MNPLDNKEVPLYQTLSQHINAVIELEQSYRTRFVESWQDYLRSEDDPNREARLRQKANEIVARAEKRAEKRYSEPHLSQYEGTIPELDEAAKRLIKLDELIMWSPRNLQELVVDFIRKYDDPSLSHLAPSQRIINLDAGIREFYNPQKK